MADQFDLLDLGDLAESDIVKAFDRGLKDFISALGGRYESRSVSLQAENTYPSDQDYAVLFENTTHYSLHLFGLQFMGSSSSPRP
jgi:hypothetical protein